MNGFKNSFDTDAIKKGMLVTATFKDGSKRSGVVSIVTNDSINFTYYDEAMDAFQNEEVTIHNVLVTQNVSLSFSTHVDNKQETAQEKTNTRQGQSARQDENSIEGILRRYFDKSRLEDFIKRQVDAVVIALVLKRFNLEGNDLAKLLYSLPDAMAMQVENQVERLGNLAPDEMKSFEEKTLNLLKAFLKTQQNTNQQQEKQSNSFGGGTGNPLEDMMRMFGNLGNGGFGGFGSGSQPELPKEVQDMTNKLEDFINGLLGNNNNNNNRK